MHTPRRILFFGGDAFSLASCRSLVAAGMKVSVVVPPAKRNTRTPMTDLRDYATARNLPVMNWIPPKISSSSSPSISGGSDIRMPTAAELNADTRWATWWRQIIDPTEYDVAVVVSFGYLLPAPLVDAFTLAEGASSGSGARAALNVHPSLLPQYRGAAPIQHAILNGDAETGVTIQQLHAHTFDAGRILAQTRVAVPRLAFYMHLHNTLADAGARSLVATVRNLEEFLAAAREQDPAAVSYARKIPAEMSRVDFRRMPRDRVYTLHRALGHKTPLYCSFRGKRLQLMSLFIPETDADDSPAAKLAASSRQPGHVAYDPRLDAVVICAGDGRLIAARRLQAESRRELPAKTFADGYQFRPDECVDDVPVDAATGVSGAGV
ncbi:hypothetical protein HDU83_006059 [Entophlyctis luteolus]|nr:hypothetical protein HDU83_006059 [Entophlyctis luteolus]